MNTLTKGLSLVALISAVSIANAAEPIELASADMDQITAGGVVGNGWHPTTPSISFNSTVGPTALAIGQKTSAGAQIDTTLTNGNNFATTSSTAVASASGMSGAVSYVSTGAVISLLTH
jgi:hypothetical protein